MIKAGFKYHEYNNNSTTNNTNTTVFFYYNCHLLTRGIFLISIVLLSIMVNISLYTYNQSIFAFKSSSQVISSNITSAHLSNENITLSPPNPQQQQQQQPSETAIQIIKIIFGSSLKGDKSYQPNPIIIRPGMTITWQNEDNILHTVTSGFGIGDVGKGKDFDSPLIQPDQMFFHKFFKSGKFPYFCALHPTMVGEVIVESEIYGTTPQQQEQEEGGEEEEGEEE
jgi:plastocyanin